MKTLIQIGMVLLIAMYAFSPHLATVMSRKMKLSSKKTLIAFMGAIGSLTFVGITVYFLNRHPEIHPLAIFVMSAGFIVFATMGIVSIAFIATIPEDIEKEADSE